MVMFTIEFCYIIVFIIPHIFLYIWFHFFFFNKTQFLGFNCICFINSVDSNDLNSFQFMRKLRIDSFKKGFLCSNVSCLIHFFPVL